MIIGNHKHQVNVDEKVADRASTAVLQSGKLFLSGTFIISGESSTGVGPVAAKVNRIVT